MHHVISTRIEGLPDNIQAFPIRHKTPRRNRQKDVLCKIVPCLTHSSMTRVVAILHFTTIILGLIKLDNMEPILLPGFRSRYSEAFLFIALFLFLLFPSFFLKKVPFLLFFLGKALSLHTHFRASLGTADRHTCFVAGLVIFHSREECREIHGQKVEISCCLSVVFPYYFNL